jgi:hypothetical protein
MRELREWCYPGRKRQHWFYINIKRALKRLGAMLISRAGGVGRPGVYAPNAELRRLIGATR